MSLLVEAPGVLSLVEDQGRPGLGRLGVSSSGAFDRIAMRQANAILGNDPSAGVIEVLGGGLIVRAERAHVVAVTGGTGPLSVDGDPVAHGRSLLLDQGQQLHVDTITAGIRAYVGVSGGVELARELGSASRDTLAGLGPPPLEAGQRLEVGTPHQTPSTEDVRSLTEAGQLTLGVVLGPRADGFSADSVRLLLESGWQVSPASDRIGVRLSGPVLHRTRLGELPSEPCLRGSIQVTAEGLPIVLGPDHPVTGGYPVIAVMADADTDRLGQARPGQILRFRSRPPRSG